MATTSKFDPSKDKTVSNKNEAGAPGSGDAKGLGIGLAKEVGGLPEAQKETVGDIVEKLNGFSLHEIRAILRAVKCHIAHNSKYCSRRGQIEWQIFN